MLIVSGRFTVIAAQGDPGPFGSVASDLELTVESANGWTFFYRAHSWSMPVSRAGLTPVDELEALLAAFPFRAALTTES